MRPSEMLMPLPLPRAAKSLYDRLRQVSEAIAVKHQVPAEVLLRKKWLDALVLGLPWSRIGDGGIITLV